jgi:acetoin utilization deacetylase AcuC-like enzyme
VDIVTPPEADLSAVSRVHGESYIQELQSSSERGGGYFTPDTSSNAHTYDAAIRAAGGGIAAVDRIMGDEIDNAYVLCRPPGHHAETRRAFGFCFINSIAVAADHLVNDVNLERVLIVDYDAHHGNGTQNTFYDTDKVLYIGLHQDGRTLFPGSGFPNELGEGEGAGHNINLSMHPGAGDVSYEKVFEKVIEPVAKLYSPEFVLVSVGYDGHFGDPLTNLGLTTSGLAMMNSKLNRIAQTHAQGRLAFFLEGGYSLDIVGHGSLNLVEELTGSSVTPLGDQYTEDERSLKYTDSLIEYFDEKLESVF